jgi:hypothetical protein
MSNNTANERPTHIRLGLFVEPGRIPKSGVIESFRVSIKKLHVNPKLRKTQPGFEILVERSVDAGRTYTRMDSTHPKYAGLLEDAIISETRKLFGYSEPHHLVLKSEPI